MGVALTASTDSKLLETMREVLQQQGFEHCFVADADEALELLDEEEPQFIVLDISNYPHDALRLCHELRSHPHVADKPILLLTRSIDSLQAAALLDAGADDLLRKPFQERELIARIKALLRWTQKAPYSIPPTLRLMRKQNIVFVNERPVYLTGVEFRLLSFLCDNSDYYYTAEDLLQDLWHYPIGEGDTALVRNHIRNLRRKIEDDPDHPKIIVSRYGRGYTIAAIVQES